MKIFNKAILLINLVFSKTSDGSTPKKRSRDRYRRIALTTLTAVAARIVNIGTGLITIPLTLSYLGTERFGLWMALTSFIAFLTFTDMGLGVGLQNVLAKCHGEGENTSVSPRSYVSSVMFVMIFICVILIVVAVLILPHIPLVRLIKVNTDAARAELLPAAQVVLIAFGFSLPAGLVQRIYNGYQQGYLANLWLLLGRIVGFVGVLFCIWQKLGLPSLIASVQGLPFVCLAIGSLWLFGKNSSLRPSIRAVNWSAMHSIFGTAVTAVGAQVAYVVLINGPAIVIANRLGTAAVTPFAVTQRLLGVLAILLSTSILPLWPAYGEAAARGDWGWVRKTTRRSFHLAAIIYIPAFVIMAVGGRYIIHIWTQDASAVPSLTLLMACNVWCVIMAWKLLNKEWY